ncbi:MAG TPA: hypothetical protein VG269_02100, partial [Tepidisphaeraceae bacterium]|nr:hypothetical protein [Tepidisphaeraceae bacterium]
MRPVWQFICRHLFIVPSFVIVAVVISWFVTQGDWRFFEAESFGDYYDGLATSMLHRRLDVPPDAIGGEAFIFEGRYYGYFGPTPALFRMPLNRFAPSLRNQWSRASMLVACLVGLLFTYLIILLLI